MIKLFFIQIWFCLSDPQTEELMHDSHAVQQFLGLDLGRDSPPDETTILRFRHLIEEHDAVGGIRGFSRVSNMPLRWQRRRAFIFIGECSSGPGKAFVRAEALIVRAEVDLEE